MKVRINEYDDCFYISLEAENVEDVSSLARFALGSTKEIRSKYTAFYKKSAPEGYIIFGKRKNLNNMIGQRC